MHFTYTAWPVRCGASVGSRATHSVITEKLISRHPILQDHGVPNTTSEMLQFRSALPRRGCQGRDCLCAGSACLCAALSPFSPSHPIPAPTAAKPSSRSRAQTTPL